MTLHDPKLTALSLRIADEAKRVEREVLIERLRWRRPYRKAGQGRRERYLAETGRALAERAK